MIIARDMRHVILYQMMLLNGETRVDRYGNSCNVVHHDTPQELNAFGPILLKITQQIHACAYPFVITLRLG